MRLSLVVLLGMCIALALGVAHGVLMMPHLITITSSLLGVTLSFLLTTVLEMRRERREQLMRRLALLRSIQSELNRNLKMLKTLPRDGAPILSLHTSSVVSGLTQGLLDTRHKLDSRILGLYENFKTINALSDKITSFMLSPAVALTNYNKIVGDCLKLLFDMVDSTTPVLREVLSEIDSECRSIERDLES